MSVDEEQLKPQSRLIDILSSFCGDDMGRSVAVRGYMPIVPTISIRGGEPRPAASVLKVPLAMAVFRLAAQQKIDLSASISVDRFPSTRYVSILAGFDRGRELSIREICRL